MKPQCRHPASPHIILPSPPPPGEHPCLSPSKRRPPRLSAGPGQPPAQAGVPTSSLSSSLKKAGHSVWPPACRVFIQFPSTTGAWMGCCLFYTQRKKTYQRTLKESQATCFLLKEPAKSKLQHSHTLLPFAPRWGFVLLLVFFFRSVIHCCYFRHVMTNVSPLRYQRHNIFCTPACANVNERRLTGKKKMQAGDGESH